MPPGKSGSPTTGVVPTARPSLRHIVRWSAAAAAVGLLVWAVSAQWHQVLAGFRQVDWATIAVAFGLVLASLFASMLSWRAVLAGLGSPLRLEPAARTYLLAQIGKYLPGGVWSVVAQAELGRDHGVPRLRSGVAAVATIVVALTVGTVLAAGALAGTAGSQLRGYAWVLLVLPVGVLVLHPRVLQWLLDLAMRVLRRDAAPPRIGSRQMAAAVGWSVVAWLLLGGHVWVVARALGATGASLPLVSLGAYAAAWVVGFLVLFAPAGAGPRELVLVLALAPVLDRAHALTLALVSRTLMLAGDLVAATVGVAAHRYSAVRRPLNHAAHIGRNAAAGAQPENGTNGH